MKALYNKKHLGFYLSVFLWVFIEKFMILWYNIISKNRGKGMEKKLFIVDVLPSGRLIKRYYKEVEGEDGKIQRQFYLAKEMNLPERIKYRVTNALFPKDENKIKRRKKGAVKLVSATTALLVAAGIGLGVVLMENDNEPRRTAKEEFAPITTVADNIQKQPTKKETEKLNPPEIKTYTSGGDTYLYYDSAIEIAKYNYSVVVDELNKYNATASEKDKYHFNPNMFDPAVFVAAQVQESSLKLYDGNDGEYKGSYKIGTSALKDVNKVSEKLYGRPVANSTDELHNPIVASRACMYYYIVNYEYLYDEIKNNNIDAEISKEMVIDTYLYGIGNISKELKGNGYKQKFHSTIINEYAAPIRAYYNKLYNEGLINVEHNDETKKMRNKLFDISNRYANEMN